MSLKNALHKAAGLFVDLPESTSGYTPTDDAPVAVSASYVAPSTPAAAPSPTPRTVEQVVQDTPGPNLDQIKVPETVKQPVLTADGSPDFPAIYQQAGVLPVSFGATEALEVIHSLPDELPIEVKRKTVSATLTAMGKAMGVTTDTVVADAMRKVAALSSFTDQLTNQTHLYQQTVDQKIAELKAQIADYEAKVTQTNDKLANVVKLCEAEGAHLEDVLEFFTLDVPPSRHA